MSQAKIAVIIHSLWGHVAELALEAVEGAKASGAEVTVFQIAETFPPDVLSKMHADKSRTDQLPEFSANDMPNFDGYIFAFGTRYGRAPAQISALFDRTGGLWASGALVGKLATIITSTGSQHGGMETTALTTMPFFIHHGIIYVPIGFQFPEVSEQGEIIGASAYSAGTITGGDNSKRPSAKDLSVAKKQGSYFASVAAKMVKS